MKPFLFLLCTLIGTGSISQHILRGQIFSINNNQPAPNAVISINKKQITTDSTGKFEVEVSKKKVRVGGGRSPIHWLDTTFIVNKVTQPIKLYIANNLDSSLAQYDIANNNLRLLCDAGFVVMAFTERDREFEREFNVRYYLMGCIVPPMKDIYSYNKTIADHLDKKYGTTWRSKVTRNIYLSKR
jgi:hypothetical protein